MPAYRMYEPIVADFCIVTLAVDKPGTTQQDRGVLTSTERVTLPGIEPRTAAVTVIVCLPLASNLVDTQLCGLWNRTLSWIGNPFPLLS